MADGFGVTFQLALAIGYATAVLAHFSLQRFFVWVHHEEFALPFRAQVGRYTLVSGAQYAMAVAVTATLPSGCTSLSSPSFLSGASENSSASDVVTRSRSRRVG